MLDAIIVKIDPAAYPVARLCAEVLSSDFYLLKK
jgi:hypothetical protein